MCEIFFFFFTRPQHSARQKRPISYRCLPDVTKEDGQEDGNGVRAVRLADLTITVLLAVGVQEMVALALAGSRGRVGVTALVLVLLVVVEGKNNAHSADGGKEPESKVSLAVVVDVADGTAVEGVVSSLNGNAVQKDLALLAAVAVTVVGGAVVGHDAVLGDGRNEGWGRREKEREKKKTKREKEGKSEQDQKKKKKTPTRKQRGKKNVQKMNTPAQ